MESTSDVKLSPTSAMVFLWADKNSFQTQTAQNYLKKINLDAGKQIAVKYLEISPKSKEIVRNRKFVVRKSCVDFLTKSPNAQVIFLAAGHDPTSIEISILFDKCTVFDIDIDPNVMEEKERLNKKLNGPSNVRFCVADLSNLYEVMNKLETSGWKKNKPTLIIAEGITYYITKESLVGVVKQISQPGGGIVCEYFISLEEMATDEVSSVKKLMTELEQDFDLPPLTKYAKNEVEDFVQKINGKLNTIFIPYDIEKERTGMNQFFVHKNSGWVHIADISFI